MSGVDEIMASERRRHYRVTAESLRSIEAWLHAEGVESPHRVALVDIAAGGAAIDAPLLKRGDLEKGSMASLEIRADVLLNSLRIQSQIVNLRNGVDRPLRAGLAFKNWMGNRSTLDPQLWRLFNQRRTVRVEPEGEIAVQLRGRHGQRMKGIIRDVSEEGLGLWVRRRGAEAAQVGQSLRIELTLPGMRKPAEFGGSSIHLEIWQGAPHARLGVELGDRRSVPPEVRRSLQQLIVERQRQLRAKGLVST